MTCSHFRGLKSFLLSSLDIRVFFELKQPGSTWWDLMALLNLLNFTLFCSYYSWKICDNDDAKTIVVLITSLACSFLYLLSNYGINLSSVFKLINFCLPFPVWQTNSSYSSRLITNNKYRHFCYFFKSTKENNQNEETREGSAKQPTTEWFTNRLIFALSNFSNLSSHDLFKSLNIIFDAQLFRGLHLLSWSRISCDIQFDRN